MQQDSISFEDTGYFSKLICNYLAEDSELQQFYNRFPRLENFEDQVQDKQASFQTQSRTTLVSVLKKQYQDIDTSESTLRNIDLLKEDTTFTITTGHQLNLFTGPLYFLYKIVCAINLSEKLNQQNSNYNFVPVYWMATEDHDFEEINYFNFKGRKVKWNRESSGAVGELSNEGLEQVFELFSKELSNSNNAELLKALFKNAYLNHSNLADATRFLANELFKEYGLVVIDANHSDLKKQFIPFFEDELLNQTCFKSVSETNNELVKSYDIQARPREINVFYLKKNLRERIILQDDVYKINNTNIFFSKQDILKELSKYPKRFSPNVIMRPLYQEVILPNLCYIGGGGELAYWLELKQFFNKAEVPFPILLLRNSVLIQSKQQTEKLKKLKISNKDIFLKQDTFINKKVREISNIEINFSSQKTHLKQQFETLFILAEQTDKSFLGAVKAQEIKQLKGIDNLEKRLLKAQKKKLANHVSRITKIQNELFPNHNLQERQTNFSEFYLECGDQLIRQLILNLQPLKEEFLILNPLKANA